MKLLGIGILSIVLIGMSCSSSKKKQYSQSNQSKTMQLIIIHGYGDSTETVSDNATDKQIIQVMNDIDWNNFNQVILNIDDKNSLGVGGNIGSDGLAAYYMENGQEYISVNPPSSVEQMLEILLAYHAGGDAFKQIIPFD